MTPIEISRNAEEHEYETALGAVADALDELEYPVTLQAVKSNWRGKTGYAQVESFTELISKCFSFDNDELTLKFNEETDRYCFSTASHDVPMGFVINIIKN